MESMYDCIATPGFALLAMTNARFFSSLLAPFAKNLHVTPPRKSLKLVVKFRPRQGGRPGEEP